MRQRTGKGLWRRMKRVLALIFMMVLAVSLSSCADSSQEADGSSLMPDTENEIAEQSMTEPEASNQYTFNALLWFWND